MDFYAERIKKERIGLRPRTDERTDAWVRAKPCSHELSRAKRRKTKSIIHRLYWWDSIVPCHQLFVSFGWFVVRPEPDVTMMWQRCDEDLTEMRGRSALAPSVKTLLKSTLCGIKIVLLQNKTWRLRVSERRVKLASTFPSGSSLDRRSNFKPF